MQAAGQGKNDATQVQWSHTDWLLTALIVVLILVVLYFAIRRVMKNLRATVRNEIAMVELKKSRNQLNAEN